jgi:FKBP-type peptidyl-prolyl cis-trans isomerase FkpA
MKKFFPFIIIGLLIIISYSCLKDSVDDIEYTPEREAAIIEEYIDSLKTKGFDVDTTDMGVFYTLVEEGEGAYPQPGDSIGIIYIGYFPESGTIFDASDLWHDEGIWNFTYMSTELIQGFNDAIGHLNINAEGLFLVPSRLAYGESGNFDGSIPPYSPLVFDIKLMNIYQ